MREFYYNMLKQKITAHISFKRINVCFSHCLTSLQSKKNFWEWTVEFHSMDWQQKSSDVKNECGQRVAQILISNVTCLGWMLRHYWAGVRNDMCPVEIPYEQMSQVFEVSFEGPGVLSTESKPVKQRPTIVLHVWLTFCISHVARNVETYVINMQVDEHCLIGSYGGITGSRLRWSILT